jgi:protein-disulfide isomerase
MNQIIAQAGTKGEVSWVLRNFPLRELHPNASAHARAVECAAETGGNNTFWNFADALFAAQPVLPKDYGTIARSAGIEGDAFASCIANPKTALDTRIQADRENALAIGAQGTPYSVIFVDGVPVDVMEGGYAYAAIEAKLKEVSE